MSALEQTCIDLEHFETPRWAVDAILKIEMLEGMVVDPCAGTGVLLEAANDAGYAHRYAIDIHDWGYPLAVQTDFLNWNPEVWVQKSTFLLNPPFSKAVEFVKKAQSFYPEKVVCFQRFAWWESKKRREFWATNAPSRVYICGDRAHCWRHDIPESKRGSSTPTAHAWFVWDRKSWDQPTTLHHIYKGAA